MTRELERVCDFCASKDVDTKLYSRAAFRFDRLPEQDELCLLCASTPAGNANQYPDQYRGEVATLKAISFVGNAILKEIRACLSKTSDKTTGA